MYFYQIEFCCNTQNGSMNNLNTTTVNFPTKTRSIQQTPLFHGCTITNFDITKNKIKCVNLCAFNTFEVTGAHKVFVYILLRFKLLKLFHKPFSVMGHLIIITHTSLSPMRRGFALGFVYFQKGALDSQSQVIQFIIYMPMVGGYLRVLRLLPLRNLVAMI